MTVRRLRAGQRGPWCSYCDGERLRATHRGVGFTKFACKDHITELEAADREQTRQDSYQTEGERQALGGFWR